MILLISKDIKDMLVNIDRSSKVDSETFWRRKVEHECR